MKIGELDTHPYADAFPLLAGVEYERFRDDIKSQGLLEKELHRHKGKLLDGRNRYRVCLELGIEPTFVDHGDDEDPLTLVVSLNYHRRHQDIGQRALSAAKLVSLMPGRRKKSTRGEFSVAEAAAAMGVSPSLVHEAKNVIKETTPDVVAAVERGDLTIAAAGELAELELAEQPAALQRVLEHETKKSRGAAARAQRDVANDEQPDARDAVIRAITRTVRALGGTIRSLRDGDLEVAIHGQVLAIHVTAREAA